MSYIEIGKTEAKLVAGGTRDTSNGNDNGYFVRPTIFSEVPEDARIAREEIFSQCFLVSNSEVKKTPLE